MALQIFHRFFLFVMIKQKFSYTNLVFDLMAKISQFLDIRVKMQERQPFDLNIGKLFSQINIALWCKMNVMTEQQYIIFFGKFKFSKKMNELLKLKIG